MTEGNGETRAAMRVRIIAPSELRSLGSMQANLNTALGPTLQSLGSMQANLNTALGPTLQSLGSMQASLNTALGPTLQSLGSMQANLNTALGPTLQSLGSMQASLNTALGPTLQSHLWGEALASDTLSLHSAQDSLYEATASEDLTRSIELDVHTMAQPVLAIAALSLVYLVIYGFMVEPLRELTGYAVIIGMVARGAYVWYRDKG